MQHHRSSAMALASAIAFTTTAAILITAAEVQTPLTCAEFATNPAAGLLGNPAVKNVTAVEKVTSAAQGTTADQYSSVTSTRAGIPFCQVDLEYSTPGMTGTAAGYAP